MTSTDRVGMRHGNTFRDVWPGFVEAFDAALRAHRENVRPAYDSVVESWHSAVVRGLNLPEVAKSDGGSFVNPF